MTESQLDEYEAWLMNPERWRNLTPEERKRDVSWLLYYTREGCKRIQEKLHDPTLAAEEQEKYTSSLDILKHREEKLREYTDDEAFAKILNSGR
jgi:hypothetical protein